MPETAPEPDRAVTMAEATAGEAGVTSGGTHPGVLVRLRDVLAHVENFFARHPELERALGTELKSGLNAVEQSGGPAAVPEPAPEAPAPEPVTDAGATDGTGAEASAGETPPAQ